MSGSFVHLHNHTEYSMLDGAAKVTPMLAEAQRLEMPAIGMTDHGNMFGASEFYNAATDAGITPIIGVDLDEFRIDRASQHACDTGINPTNVADLRQEIVDRCPEDGANIVLECTGLPRVFPQATGLACLGGKLVAVGSPRGTVDMDFLQDVHLREVSIHGAHQPKTPEDDHIYYRWTKTRERALVLRLMAAGRLPLSHLITHESVPHECQEVYTMLADDPKDVLGVLFAWKD